MLKISRLTDYGLLASVYLARNGGQIVAAREIAEFYHLPIPAVTKVLKTLHHGGLIRFGSGRREEGLRRYDSRCQASYLRKLRQRAFEGEPESITLGQLIEMLEGPWDLTECETYDHDGNATCAIRVACPSRRFMFGINRAVKGAFEQVTLGDLLRGGMPIPVIDKQRLTAHHEAAS